MDRHSMPDRMAVVFSCFFPAQSGNELTIASPVLPSEWSTSRWLYMYQLVIVPPSGPMAFQRRTICPFAKVIFLHLLLGGLARTDLILVSHSLHEGQT